MLPASRPPFQVIESADFTHQAEIVLGNFWAWEHIKETFDLDVARDPYAFEQIEGTSYRAVRLNTDPPRTVYFTIDNLTETVTLEWIE